MAGRDFDEALVRLWNEVEPLRLAGDTSGLEAAERRAMRIAREGDEAQQREAERLLETLRKTRAQEYAAVVATGRRDADVETAGSSAEIGELLEVGEPVDMDGYPEDVDELEGERPRRGVRWTQLVWVAVFLIVVIVNILSGR
jgi:hypothetical protein